jgi:hypothetical protein
MLFAIDAPWWGNGAFGLLGTAIGALITYITTTRANLRKEKDERERQRLDRIRDVSTTFIQTVSRQSVTALKVQGIDPRVSELIEQLKSGSNLAGILATWKSQPGVHPDNAESYKVISALNAAKGLVEGVAAVQPAAAETTALVAEMRLLLPTRLVNLAELVAAVAIVKQVLANFPKDKTLPTEAFNTVLNAFANGIREEMGLERYVPSGITLQNLGEKASEMLREHGLE